MRVIRVALFSVVIIVFATDAWTCTTSAGTPASFGSMTSFAVQTTEQSTSSSNAGITCTGAIAEILASGNFINATMTSEHGALTGQTGDQIGYSLYADPAGSIPIQLGVTVNYLTPALLNLLGLFQGSAVSIPVYLRTVPGANVAQGIYQDTVSIDWHWRYCTGAIVGSLCVLGTWVEGTSTSEIVVTLTVTPTCQITATPDIDFGQAPMAGMFASVVQSVAVICTKGLDSFSVGLSAGESPVGGRRRMSRAADRLEYDLFKGATGEVWGSAGAERYVTPVPANGLAAQLFTYTATIYGDQDTPPPGSYTDVVIVDVDF